MTTISPDQRIAILLRMLGQDVAESVLQQLPPEGVETMKASLAELEAAPPSEEEMDEVLDEFHRLLRFAVSTGSAEPHEAADRAQDELDPKEAFEPTGDPFVDLARLQSYQIAGALRDESPATVAVVLGCLPAEHAGEVIQQLPQDIRKEVFLRMNSHPQVPQPLLARVVQATVDKGCRLDPSSATDPDALADAKLAKVLRAMNRANRQEMLQALDETDQETGARVKDLLYVFADLLKLTDRCVQKLLAEIDTATLAAALKNAEEGLVERITSNLSKRARATLLEEIEFLGSVSTEQQEAAEKAICEVLARLDQAGDLEMME